MYIKNNEIENGFPAISEEDIKKFKGKETEYKKIKRKLNIQDLQGKATIFRIYYGNNNHTIYYDGKKIFDSWLKTNTSALLNCYDSSISLNDNSIFRQNALQQDREQGYCALFSIVNSRINKQKQRINTEYKIKFRNLMNSVYEFGENVRIIY